MDITLYAFLRQFEFTRSSRFFFYHQSISAFCILHSTNTHTPIIDELLDWMQSYFCKSKHLKSFVMNMHRYWFVCFLCPIQIPKIMFSVLVLTFNHVKSFFFHFKDFCILHFTYTFIHWMSSFYLLNLILQK